MKVRILTARLPTYPAGAEVEIDDAAATAWIGGGHAEPLDLWGDPAVESPGKKRGKKGAERATAEPGDDPAVESRG